MLLITVLTFCLLPALRAQAPAQVSASARTPEEVDELLVPIVLYPDALVALILPASTMPSEIVQAKRYVVANGDAGSFDSQPVDNLVDTMALPAAIAKYKPDRNGSHVEDLYDQ